MKIRKKYARVREIQSKRAACTTFAFSSAAAYIFLSIMKKPASNTHTHIQTDK